MRGRRWRNGAASGTQSTRPRLHTSTTPIGSRAWVTHRASRHPNGAAAHRSSTNRTVERRRSAVVDNPGMHDQAPLPLPYVRGGRPPQERREHDIASEQLSCLTRHRLVDAEFHGNFVAMFCHFDKQPLRQAVEAIERATECARSALGRSAEAAHRPANRRCDRCRSRLSSARNDGHRPPPRQQQPARQW